MKLRLARGSLLSATASEMAKTDLLIDDGRIIGMMSDPTPEAVATAFDSRAWDEIECDGCLILPGFRNAHTHPGATPMLRGIADELDIPEQGAFYHNVIPLRSYALRSLSPEELLAIVQWDVASMVSGGATTIVAEDFGSVRPFWETIVDEIGFRSSYGLTYPQKIEAIGYTDAQGAIQRGDAGDPEQQFHSALDVLENGSASPLLSHHLSPHGSDTVPKRILRETAHIADANSLAIHMHASQHLDEMQSIKDRANQSPTEYLESLGLLGERTYLTHNTYASEDDWRRISATQTTAVLCPVRKLREGIVGGLKHAVASGCRTQIGTDSFSHDMFDEMKLFSLLAKAEAGRQSTPRAASVIQTAIGRNYRSFLPEDIDDLSALRPRIGDPADLIVLDCLDPCTGPLPTATTGLVNYGSAGQLRHSIIAGKPVIRDGQFRTLDLSSLGERVDSILRGLWNEARAQGVVRADRK